LFIHIQLGSFGANRASRILDGYERSELIDEFRRLSDGADAAAAASAA